MAGIGIEFINKGLLPTFLGVGCVAGVGTFLKNTLFIKNFMNSIELQGDDGPIEPSDDLFLMVNSVMEDLKGFVSPHTPIVPFVVPGLKTISAGTLGTFQGGVVGLPVYFEYKTKEDIQEKVLVNKTNLKYDEEVDMEKVYSSFLLSDEAKKYAIAREIFLVNSYQAYIDLLIPVFTPIAIAKISTTMNEKSSSPAARALLTLFITLLGLSVWRLVHSKAKKYYEKDAELAISKLGKNYIKGGIEYNTKVADMSSYSVELKNQNYSLVKRLGDKIRPFVEAKPIPSTSKVEFYTKLLSNEQVQSN